MQPQLHSLQPLRASLVAHDFTPAHASRVHVECAAMWVRPLPCSPLLLAAENKRAEESSAELQELARQLCIPTA